MVQAPSDFPPPPEWRQQIPHGRVLVFAPHPDDEIAGPGGILALHRQNGDPVRAVITTTGEAGDPDGRYAGEDYVALRERESRAGLFELGVDDAVYWGLPDSCELSPSDYEMGYQLATQAITDYRPDLIYLTWEAEGHSDHHAVHLIVCEAMRRANFRGQAYGYEVWNAMIPDIVVDISKVAEQKRRAIRAHASQLAYGDFERAIMGLNAYRSMVHARGQGYCEALRRIELG